MPFFKGTFFEKVFLQQQDQESAALKWGQEERYICDLSSGKRMKILGPTVFFNLMFLMSDFFFFRPSDSLSQIKFHIYINNILAPL